MRDGELARHDAAMLGPLLLGLLSSMAMRQFLGFLPRQIPYELLEKLMEMSTASPGPIDS